LSAAAPPVAVPQTTSINGGDAGGRPPTVETPLVEQSSPTPTPTARGLSIWWLIVPTLIYFYLARDIVSTLILAAIGAGLWYAHTRNEVPFAARPYLLLLQSVLVFFFLGGNPIIIVGVLAALVGAVLQRSRLIPALEPWWQIQQRIPPTARRVIAVVVTLAIGYSFGRNASGNEWTYTFLSIVMATVVAFLLMFTPPDSLRRPRTGRPT
jgi:hypothetical protein